jgi:hypothetical protein
MGILVENERTLTVSLSRKGAYSCLGSLGIIVVRAPKSGILSGNSQRMYLLKKKGEVGVLWACEARPQHPTPRFIEKLPKNLMFALHVADLGSLIIAT